jgi:sterol desaturase/sphingolipid hydroxylase (fatty acid hydroxylase superfamily)
MTFASPLSGDFWQQVGDALYRATHGVNGRMLLLFWGVLAVAALVTFAQTHRPHSLRGLFAHLLPASTLRHPSARADFLFWLSRRIFMPLLVLPLAFSTVAAGHVAYSLLASVLGPPAHAAGAAGPLTLVVFTITMFLAYDLSYYLYHVMQHRIPFMWELHKVHHSAEVMIGVTKDRVHPFDELMNHWWNGVLPGLAYGIWLFFALDPIEVTIYGIDVYFIRNTLLMMDFVRHTHMKLSYGRWCNWVFICPHYHQLHHSVAPEHWDKNFGLTLTLWDWLFGTLVVPKPSEDFVFGLQDSEAKEYQSLARLHYLPIKKILLLMRHHWALRPIRALKGRDDSLGLTLQTRVEAQERS